MTSLRAVLIYEDNEQSRQLKTVLEFLEYEVLMIAPLACETVLNQLTSVGKVFVSSSGDKRAINIKMKTLKHLNHSMLNFVWVKRLV